MGKLKRLAPALFLAALLAVTGCALPNMPEFTNVERSAVPDGSVSSTGSSGQPLAYRQWDDSISLEWDAALGPVTAYRVYVRTRGGGEWELLTEVSASEAPPIEIGRSDTGSGSYEFAVSSVAADGSESEKHTSLDDDADPPSGWYVVWE